MHSEKLELVLHSHLNRDGAIPWINPEKTLHRGTVAEITVKLFIFIFLHYMIPVEELPSSTSNRTKDLSLQDTTLMFNYTFSRSNMKKYIHAD